MLNPYQRTIIYPEVPVVGQFQAENPAGVFRESYSLVKRVVSPKYIDSLVSASIKEAGFQSLIATSLVALFIIAAVGAAGHCSPTMIGGTLTAIGGSTLLYDSMCTIQYHTGKNPFLKAAVPQKITHALLFSGTFLILGITVLTGSTSAVLGSKIALGTLFVAPVASYIVHHFVISKFSLTRNANENAWRELISSFFQLPLESLNYFARHPIEADLEERKKIAAGTLILAAILFEHFQYNYVDYIIQRLEERSLAQTVSAQEKASVDETLALVRGLQTLKNGQQIDEDLKPPLLEVLRLVRTLNLQEHLPLGEANLNHVLDPYFTTLNFTEDQLRFV